MCHQTHLQPLFSRTVGWLEIDVVIQREAQPLIKTDTPAAHLVFGKFYLQHDRIVVKACRKRPEERFRSAAQMKEAILEALKDGSNFKAKKGLLSRIFGFK